MNIDANYIINQIKPGISEDDINKIINDYLASLGIDSQAEIDEATEQLFPDIEAKISELETSLTDLKKTLSGNLSSEESRNMGNSLLEDLEDKISDMETLSKTAHDELNHLSQNIFDGTDGQQVVVPFDNTMFSDGDSMDPLIINLGNGSSSYLDGLIDESEVAANDPDGNDVTNFDDIKTSKDITELQQIVLDFSSLDGATTDVASYDASGGRLVLKTTLLDGSFKLTEIRNFDPKKQALIIKGLLMTDANADHWTDTAPDAVTQAIYTLEGGGDVNLYDMLHYSKVDLDTRLQYIGFKSKNESGAIDSTYNDLISSTNLNTSFNSYGTGSELTSQQFAANMKLALHSLYQIIDNPSLDETEKGKLYNETLAALNTGGLSGIKAANMLALSVLHLLKYDPTNAGILLSDGALAQITTVLTSAVDADGNHSPLAIAAYIATEKLVGPDGIGMGVSEETIRSIFTKEGSTDIENPEDLKACLLKTQQIYSAMGYGSNTAVDAMLVKINKAPDPEKPSSDLSTVSSSDRTADGKDNIVDYGLDHLKNLTDDITYDENIDEGLLNKYIDCVITEINNGASLSEALNHPLAGVSDPAGNKPFSNWHRDNIMFHFIRLLEKAVNSTNPDLQRFAYLVMKEGKDSLITGLQYKEVAGENKIASYEQNEYRWVRDWVDPQPIL